MNHGHPFKSDIVVGDFSVKSSEALLGMPTLSNVLKACLDCDLGICHMLDDEGQTWVFGKNRSKVPRAELDALCAVYSALHAPRDETVAKIGTHTPVKRKGDKAVQQKSVRSRYSHRYCVNRVQVRYAER